MTPFSIVEEAALEVDETVAYYECCRPGLGLQFLSEIERAFYVIAEAPHRWRVRTGGDRRFLTRRFPYVIVYLFENNHVWILAVAHVRRKDGYWAGRELR